MKSFLEDIKEKVLVFDGSKGYMLQRLGLTSDECPELWNVTHSEKVKEIYQAYKDAGSDVIQTNTFTGSRPHLEKYSLHERVYEINYAGARLAREVMGSDGYVAASVGPIGRLFEPSGDLTFEEAYEVYKEQVKALAYGGVDIINFETFTDIAEMRAALLAVRETVNLPVVCSMAFEANGRTLMGSDPQIVAVVLKSLGADMVGANCSFGPEQLLGIIKNMSESGCGYLSVKPNAGLPEMIDGKVVYNELPETFSKLAQEFLNLGVRLIGGCCGTTPEFVRAIKEKVIGFDAPVFEEKFPQAIASPFRLLNVEGTGPINAGSMSAETNKEFASAIVNDDMDAVADMSLDMSTEDYDAVHICINDSRGDEKLLARVVNTVQGYVKVPLIIESSNPVALGHALRIYKGRAGVIFSGNDSQLAEELAGVAEKYGSVIIDKSRIECCA